MTRTDVKKSIKDDCRFVISMSIMFLRQLFISDRAYKKKHIKILFNEKEKIMRIFVSIPEINNSKFVALFFDTSGNFLRRSYKYRI